MKNTLGPITKPVDLDPVREAGEIAAHQMAKAMTDGKGIRAAWTFGWADVRGTDRDVIVFAQALSIA